LGENFGWILGKKWVYGSKNALATLKTHRKQAKNARKVRGNAQKYQEMRAFCALLNVF